MNVVNASIITIGDELLIGQTIDTNSAFIAQELNRIGIWVKRRVAVGDISDDIWQALDEESRNAQVIIITGGLGPTADDITKPLLCKYFGGKMVTDEKVLAHVTHLFKNIYRRTGPILDRNLRQAEVPDVCRVLHNERGSAPGMWFDRHHAPDKNGNTKCVFISLPGVPHEMKGLMINEVIPALLTAFKMPAIVHRTAFTFGQGESVLAELLREFEPSLPPNIKLAYLPNYGMVKLRLTSIGDSKEIVEREILPYFNSMQELVKEFLVTSEDEDLEMVIGRILKDQGRTVVTAESCTGGYIAHLLTSVAGSSAYFNGSVIAYSNDVKEKLLRVSANTLKTYGAVSEQTVTEMVRGALAGLSSDYALATSGIMGPGGGSPEKPVGTVWIAAGNMTEIKTLQLHLRFDRQRNIVTTAGIALNFLRKFILEKA